MEVFLGEIVDRENLIKSSTLENHRKTIGKPIGKPIEIPLGNVKERFVMRELLVVPGGCAEGTAGLQALEGRKLGSYGDSKCLKMLVSIK